MEMERSCLTERILNLTLEIIYLLTGEDYTLVKKTTGDRMTPNNHHGAPAGWSRSHIGVIELFPPFPTPERNDQKILEVTQKIIELLTDEVPIRCQDVTVYFSMEEWEYLEGHKELFKDIMVASQPALTSPDGCSNENPAERCPRALYSQDSTQEHVKTQQNDQVEDVIIIKAEVLEEAEKLMSSKSCKEENIYSEIRTDSGGTQKDFMTEKKKEEHRRIKEEENPIEIRHDGRYRMYGMSDRSAVLSNTVLEDNIMEDLSGENPAFPNIQAVPQGANLSLDPSTQDGTMVDHMYPGTYTVCRAEEPFLCYVSNNYCCQGPKRTSQPKSDLASPRSECGKCFVHASSYARHAPVKTHPCSQCGRCFSQKSNLLRHLRFHTVDRPYMCSACSRCFSQKSDLLRHQRIHTGEKPYSCLVCGRCFAQKSNLLRHHRSHSGERPFSCSQCGKCFAKKQDLVSHQTKHTKMT